MTGAQIDQKLRCASLEIIEQEARHRAGTAGGQAFDSHLVVGQVGLEFRCLKLDRAGLVAVPALGFKLDFFRQHRLRPAVGSKLGRTQLDLEGFTIHRSAHLKRQLLRIDGQRVAINLEVAGRNLAVQAGQIQPGLALFRRLTQRACHLGLQLREGELLFLQVEQYPAGKIDLCAERRLGALRPRCELDLARHLVGDPASGQTKLPQAERLPARIIAIGDGRPGQLDALDIELDLVFSLFVLRQQIVEIEFTVTPANQIRSQAVDLDLVDDQLFFQQRQQIDKQLGPLKLHELFVALEFGQGHLSEFDAELGKHLERDVAGDRQRALLLLLHQLGQIVLVFVRIEGRGDDADGHNQQGDEAADDDAKPLEQFHGESRLVSG